MRIEFSRKTKLRFLITVLAAVIVGGIIHSFVLTQLSGKLGVLYLSYLVQLVLSIVSFFAIAKISQAKGEQAGFYFLGLSILKFLVYILGFRFYFIADGEVSKLEYAIFFVPYIIAFAVEIVFLVRELNNAYIDPDKVIVYNDEEE